MADRQDEIHYNDRGDAVSFVGRGAVDVFAMAVLASALRLYANTGLKANRGYTPSRMIAAARLHLGPDVKIGAREYLRAADLLSERVQAEKSRIAAEAAR